MENEQRMSDPEAGFPAETFNQNIQNNACTMCEIPITSEHCAASLSLADASITKKDSNDSTETSQDLMEMIDIVENHPRRLSRRSLLWICLLLTVVVVLLIAIGVSARRNAPAPRPEYSAVVEYLLSHNISSYEELTTDDDSDDDSPHSRAARWLAESDPARLPVPVTKDYLYVTRYVMALNYFAMGGDQWTMKVNFMTESHVCDWNGAKNAFGGKGVEVGGLSCDENGLPRILDLEFNSLAGSIPTENGLLTTLTDFDMQVNDYIGGTFPPELCNLANLKSLTLRGNDLEGSLPSCLGKLQKLTNLNLENNNFSGKLPTDLCAMTHMQYLVMQRNLLSGNLPSCMGKWSNLKVLAISDNAFSGELPTELENLKRLQELTLDDNKLSGDPLPIASKLADLKIFYASDNQFSGTLNTQTCKDLTQLEIFDISGNNFTSTELPTHLLQMPKLEVLDLSMNSLKGHLPEDIQENNALWFFSAHSNLLDGGIPSALKKLSSLRHLDLSDNKLHGPLRNELFEMASLENLFLSENPELHQGSIPATVSDMKQLKELSLKNTNRNGTLPELLDFVNLSLLDLDNNGFTGTIPENYARLPNLVYLLLNRNPIHGRIPDFHNAELLHTVLLDGTKVSGDFSSICGLPAFIGDPDFSARPIAVADCDGENGRIHCACCHCCDTASTESGSCSDPIVANLDWTWEYGFRREARDFAINRSALKDPIA